jgi:hypothetical protein
MTAELHSKRLKQLLEATNQDLVAKFLREVQLLPGTKTETEDPTKRQLEEYKLAISKGIGKIVTAAGGVGALLAASGTAIGAFKKETGDNVTVALIVSGAVLITASILGLALILRADVSGRAAVSTQIVEERGVVISSLLKLVELVEEQASNQEAVETSQGEKVKEAKTAAEHEAEEEKANRKAAAEQKLKEQEGNDLMVLLGLASFGNDIEITTAHGTHSVLGLRHEGGKLQVLQTDRDWVDVSDIKSFTTKTPPSR